LGWRSHCLQPKLTNAENQQVDTSLTISVERQSVSLIVEGITGDLKNRLVARKAKGMRCVVFLSNKIVSNWGSTSW
jgi:hypothetical protein